MATAKWKQISKENFAQLVKESRSFRELADKLGYACDGGGTIKSLKEAVKQYQLDISHFLGQGWNKNNFDYSSFSTHSNKKNGKNTQSPLIALRGRKCECCGITEWLGQPINLEIHHLNGDRSDNRLENLQLLCPNCHSYTNNFCGKTKRTCIEESDFVEALLMSSSVHAALTKLGLVGTGGNYDRAYKLIDKYDISHLKTKSTGNGNILSECELNGENPTGTTPC